MPRQKRTQTPPMALPVGMPGGSSQAVMGQAVTVALLAASQDGCDCRACQALRKAAGVMTDQFLEEEDLVGSDDSL